MRALRVVGIADDGSVILEDPGRNERFTVPADEQLRAAARGDMARLGQIAIEVESQLRPREIQARIRAGASVEQVAAAAGVPAPKIERFAYPVLLERMRTAELAQAAHPVRDDGPDLRTLLETVAHTFGLRGQDHTEASWDSWKGEDGKWVVALSWRSGRSDIRAHWAFHPGAHGGTVTALDQHAADLVEGRPQQPLRPVGPVIDLSRADDATSGESEPAEEQVRAAAGGEAPSRVAPEQRRTSSPAPRREPAPRQADRPPEPRAENGAAAANGPAGAMTVGDPVATPGGPAGGEPAGSADEPTGREGGASAARSAPDREPDVDRRGPGAPTPPADQAAEPGRSEPAGSEARDEDSAGSAGRDRPGTGGKPDSETPATAKRTKKGKPVMPSWDEVLLGVRGQR